MWLKCRFLAFIKTYFKTFWFHHGEIKALFIHRPLYQSTIMFGTNGFTCFGLVRCVQLLP
uniref:Uncharacterized protein n=1 Tax=Anguilla anguilla TaxID=7936 RepID=A0A0E9WMV1_ANGAN